MSGMFDTTFFFHYGYRTLELLIPKSADTFVNSYYLKLIFFVMTAFLEGYENRSLSGSHCSADPSIRENQLFSRKSTSE